MDDLRPVTVAGPAYASAWTAASRRAQCKLPERAAAATVEFFTAHWPRARAGWPAAPARPGRAAQRPQRRLRVIYRVDDGRRLVTAIAIEHRRHGNSPWIS